MIDQDRADAGRRILDSTDDVGFDAYAAGWIRDLDSEKWLYFLSTPMLQTKGPLWVYSRLLKVFKHRPLPPVISPLDVAVLDPVMEGAILPAEATIENTPRLSEFSAEPEPIPMLTSKPLSIHGLELRNAVVYLYRRLRQTTRQRRTSAVNTFDQKVKLLDRAA